MTTALPALIRADETNVFPRYLEWAYPSIERAEGVRLFRTDGTEILDACGGGAMVACLGHGRHDIVDAAARQAEQLSYVYYHAFTNERQEELADRVIEVAAPEMARARRQPLADRLAGPVLPRLDPWNARADGPP